MNVAPSLPERRKRGYRRSGLYCSTPTAEEHAALAEVRAALLADLGGVEHVSTARRILVDLAAASAVRCMRISAYVAEDVPAVVARLESLLAYAASRLALDQDRRQHDPAADVVLDVAAAAALLGRSVSWMRKRGRSLPGYVQPTGHGGRVGWRRRDLVRWRDGG